MDSINDTLAHLLDHGYNIQTLNIELFNKPAKEVFIEGKVWVEGNRVNVEGIGKGQKYEDALSVAILNLKYNIDKVSRPVKKMVKALGEMK
jgi:hypothetical protein